MGFQSEMTGISVKKALEKVREALNITNDEIDSDLELVTTTDIAAKMPLVLGKLTSNHTIAGSDYIPVAAAPDGDAEKVNLTNLKTFVNADRQTKINASGILKGNGSGGVSAAVAGTDYQAPIHFKTDPEGAIYRINNQELSARYDYSDNEIHTTYATKTELNGKEAKGKITISGVEKTANTHTVTIVTNGVTSNFTLVGVS